MEQSNTNEFFHISTSEIELKSIQTSVMNILNNLFIEYLVSNFSSEIEIFKGVRGVYEDKLNILLSFSFNYNIEFKIEIYLYYDQLEYYIFKGDKMIKECNLEDFWEEEIHVIKFINYLKKDLEKLKIPFKL